MDPRRLKLPNITVNSYSSLGGVNSRNNTATDIHEFAANATTVAGATYVALRVRLSHLPGQHLQPGQFLRRDFTFDATWTRGPLDNSPTCASQLGQSMASFLYGLPGSGNFPINDSHAEQSSVPALYIQNDWKVSRKLTLSLGIPL